MTGKTDTAQAHTHYLITDQPQYTRNRFKIAIAGSNGCGKTAFARRLSCDMFSEPGTAESAAPFRQVFQKQLPNGSFAKIELIDVGMEQLNEHARTANTIRQRLVSEGTKQTQCTEFVDLCGIFLLYDITNLQSFNSLGNIIGDLSHLISPDCEIFIVGCKADLKEERKVSYKDAENMSLNIGFSLFETSSKTGKNCSAALDEMIDKIIEKQEEAASCICDSVEQTEPTQRFVLPNIFCSIWTCN